MTTPADLLALATDIAQEAARLAHDRRAKGVDIAASKSSLADIVTEADRDVETLIRSRLEKERPGDGFLGEESGTASSATGLTWVVDPIDGTVNYAFGIPAYAVSIAVVSGEPQPQRWSAEAGMVVAPALGETFTAARGGGAYLNGRPIQVTSELAAAPLVATGFGYDPDTHAATLAELGAVMPHVRDIRRGGSAALDLSYVAAGRLDGYYERGLNAWDLAAGALLVTEAGGRLQWGDADKWGRVLLIAAGEATLATIGEAFGLDATR